MPELPEVETIRRSLQRQVPGLAIKRVRFSHREAQRRILRVGARRLARELPGQTVLGFGRRGKFLTIELDRHHLIFHLGMTGQLTFRDPDREDARRFTRHPVTGLQRAGQHAPDRHTHLQIFFGNGAALLYRDIRQFGKVFLLPKRADELKAFFSRLGLEPFGRDYQLKVFLERFKNRKLPVKSLLLDQSFVAGVGNIYADEALFEAGIDPNRSALSLRQSEKERLFRAIRLVLRRGIQFGGTTLRDFIDGNGEEGRHQEELRVYGRTGEPCLVCGAEIERIVISQRSTHFCPRCQGAEKLETSA